MFENVSEYGLLGGTGFLCGFLYLLFRFRDKEKRENAVYIYVFSALFAMLFAKLLYLLVNLKDIIDVIKATSQYKALAFVLIRGGFVFYGGLIGALTGFYVMIRYFGLKSEEYMPLMVPCIPLVHGFGRIGCHLVGCCYGRVTSSHFAITYTDSLYAPNGVNLIPVQIIEAVFVFILFIILFVMGFKERLKGFILPVYLVSYSLFRFVMEYFRGDELRGIWGPFSTSQWISISVFALGAFLIIRHISKRPV